MPCTLILVVYSHIYDELSAPHAHTWTHTLWHVIIYLWYTHTQIPTPTCFLSRLHECIYERYTNSHTLISDANAASWTYICSACPLAYILTLVHALAISYRIFSTTLQYVYCMFKKKKIFNDQLVMATCVFILTHLNN